MTPRLLLLLAVLLPGFSSCGKPDPSKAPVINTPAGAKVDLSKVSLVLANTRITRVNGDHYVLDFDYTVHNQAGAHIAFLCLYNEMDDLIEVNLSDKEGHDLVLGRRPLDGLTLTAPRHLRIPIGETTRSYTVPLMPALHEKGDPISVRVRLHAPSRYDELRSSVEAPTTQVPWP